MEPIYTTEEKQVCEIENIYTPNRGHYDVVIFRRENRYIARSLKTYGIYTSRLNLLKYLITKDKHGRSENLSAEL
jgi:hypothetical protein